MSTVSVIVGLSVTGMIILIVTLSVIVGVSVFVKAEMSTVSVIVG